METIEQAKNRLEVTMDGKNGFYRGVLWANRWIEPENELPKNREVVLAKVPLINYPLLFCFNEIENCWYQFEDGEFYKSEINPICWRPIERY